MPGTVPKWFPIAGYASAAGTLGFFMYVALFQSGRPNFAHIVVMAFAAGLATTFLGGDAAATGEIPTPFLKSNPIAFSATGGIAVFLIVLLLGWTLFLRDGRSNRDSDVAFQRASGTISQPSDRAVVTARFDASGTAQNVDEDVYLWLAVEISGRIWPKEGTVSVKTNGRWSAPVFEDGRPDQFGLSLWAANPQANRQLHAWLERGLLRGDFAELQPLPGMKRLARVEGLRVAANR